MRRKEFFRACLVGVASCACGGLGPLEACAAPAVDDAQEGGAAQTAEDKAVDAIRVRYATLVALIARHVPEETQRTIFRELGRECARQLKGMTYEKYGGNIDAFLAEARSASGWMASAEYRPQGGGDHHRRSVEVLHVPAREERPHAGGAVRVHPRMAGGDLLEDPRASCEGVARRVDPARQQPVCLSG